MILTVQLIAVGFLIATWIGAFLGFLEEWKPTLFVMVLFVVGTAVVASAMIQGPAEAAASMSWPVVIGSAPGYLFGFYGGRILYRYHFEGS